jgi:Tfp pilus assembly protein PilV
VRAIVRHHDEGFTLIEVTAASLLVAGMAASVAALPAVASRAGQSARRATSVALIAAHEVDVIRAVPPTASSGVEYFDGAGRSTGTAPTLLAAYVCRWTANPAPFNPSAVIFRVSVFAIAADGQRTASGRDVKLTTVVWRGGP